MRKKKQAETERINKALKASTYANEMQDEYIDELMNDPKNAVIADPTGELMMSEEVKTFIMHYVQFKNVATAADLTGISMDEAKKYFVSYNVQQEIRRINRALYHRQFCNKLLTIDELGGYLSSLLTDENVPVADQLRTSDKLRVVDMLIKLNEVKGAAIEDPNTLIYKDLEYEVQDLSVETITALLNSKDTLNQKNELIMQLNGATLTPEEKDYLKTLPAKDLLRLINDIKQGDEN